MWQVLKAEIEYNKWILIGVYGASVSFFIGGFFGPCCAALNIVPNTLIPFFIGYGFLCNTHCKERRHRQHCMLPQSRNQQGVTRVLFHALYLGGINVLWLLTYVTHIGETPGAIWAMLTSDALVMAFVSIGYIFADTRSQVFPITTSEGWQLSSLAQRLFRFFTWVAMTILVLLAAAGDGRGFSLMQVDVEWPPVVALREFLRSPVGFLLSAALFLVMFYVSTMRSLPQRVFASTR